jgi:CHAT domain-containing protein
LGEDVLGEGVFSLSRSFLKAGARSVISTLWKINDKISADQVLQIYKNLIKGYSKDEAIRAMQLDYIRGSSYGNKYAMPFYWAAFQCHGDSGPIMGLKEKSNASYWILLFLSVIPILYFLVRMKMK